MLLFFRLGHSHREIIPLDKWEILPEQLKYEEKLGQGAFGVVHKAILKRREGLEVFYTKATKEGLSGGCCKGIER